MILTYHKIGSQIELGITTVSRRRFAGHLDIYNELGFKPVLTCELISPAEGDAKTTDRGERRLAITFDDGYESVCTQAFPEMASRGWAGTVFVVAGSVGGSNTWDVRLSPRSFRHLSWEQIRELADAGFEIGSHTLSHRDLTRLNEDRLRSELRDSKHAIEDHTGRPVRSISYPFGRFSCRVVEEALAAGYECGFTSFPNDGTDPMAIGRLSVYSIDSRAALERKLSLRPGYKLECFKNKVIARLSLGTTLVKRQA